MPNKIAKRLVDSKINTIESDESMEQTQAELKREDPVDTEGEHVIAALLQKNETLAEKNV